MMKLGCSSDGVGGKKIRVVVNLIGSQTGHPCGGVVDYVVP